jgi:hypothetical protein
LLGAFEAIRPRSRGGTAEFLDEWQSNRTNGNEEDWQQILTRESWVLGQLFGAPFVIVKGKAYVGGKTFENLEGRVRSPLRLKYESQATQVSSAISPGTEGSPRPLRERREP